MTPFFGGRTGAVALHAVAEEGEEIRYVDVNSLYTWVNKNCPYPIGHPKIITQPVDKTMQRAPGNIEKLWFYHVLVYFF